MFSYVFCDDEAYPRCDSPPFYMALCCCYHEALACTPLGKTFQHKRGCRTRQQIEKTVFKLFNFYSSIIVGVGEGGSKNYQEIKRGVY